MAFRGIYFEIIAAEPIKEVVYCCFKVRYNFQKCVPTLIWGGVICII